MWAPAALAGVATMAASKTATWLATTHGKEHEIFDLGHRVLPGLQYSHWKCVVPMVLPLALLRSWDDATDIFNFVVPRFVVLLLIRSITTVVTVPPKSDQTCDATRWSVSDLVLGQCYDKMFSGHLALVTLIAIAFVRQGLLSTAWAALYVGLNAVVMLMTRGHYTVDVVIGIVLALLISMAWPGDTTETETITK